jgi:hypothetical protein
VVNLSIGAQIKINKYFQGKESRKYILFSNKLNDRAARMRCRNEHPPG